MLSKNGSSPSWGWGDGSCEPWRAPWPVWMGPGSVSLSGQDVAPPLMYFPGQVPAAGQHCLKTGRLAWGTESCYLGRGQVAMAGGLQRGLEG